MARRYSFLILFLAALSPLAWWSEQVRPIQASQAPVTLAAAAAMTEQRRELLEALDRLVAYEHYYRSVYGHFTVLLSRLGYPLPAQLVETYEVHVTEASEGRLLITAVSESNGQVRDRISVDQNYEVTANFQVPEPRPEYLKAIALRQLRVLQDAPVGKPISSLEERGIFSGYFKFELRRDPQDRKVVVAEGLRAPVAGLHLELGSETTDFAEIGQIGQKPSGSVMSTLEEAYLAQRIFRGEMGRYAKNWSELSKIAAFRFEDKEQFGRETQVPFGDAGSLTEIDVSSKDGVRTPSSEIQPIEIEPISNSSN
jgi:hypothetical protein